MTRQNRLGGKPVIAYHITDTTTITKVSMPNLLAHVNTKDELTTYLAGKIYQNSQTHRKSVVVAWRDCVNATHRDVTYLASTHKEADTCP